MNEFHHVEQLGQKGWHRIANKQKAKSKSSLRVLVELCTTGNKEPLIIK